MILFFKHPDVHIYSIYLLIFQILHSTSKLELYIFFKSLDTIITIKTFTLVSVMAHGRPVVSTCSTFYL